MIQTHGGKYNKKLQDFLDEPECYDDMEIPSIKYYKRDSEYDEVELTDIDSRKSKLGFVRYLGSSKTSRERALVEGWLKDVEFYTNILDGEIKNVELNNYHQKEKLISLEENSNKIGEDDFEFNDAPLALSKSKLDKQSYLNSSLSTFSASIGSLDSISEKEDFGEDLVIPSNIKKLSLKLNCKYDADVEDEDMEDGLELPETLIFVSKEQVDPIKTAFVNSNAHTTHQTTPERFNNFKDPRFYNQNESTYTGNELNDIEIPSFLLDISEFEEKTIIQKKSKSKPTLLLKSLINTPKTVNNMTFNLQKKIWDGNDDALKPFELKKETIITSAVVDHATMVFDPITMTWTHKENTDDIFADIPDILVQREIIDESAFVVYPDIWNKSDKNHKQWAKNYFSIQSFRPASFKSGKRTKNHE